jgi:hypothetical protein
MGATKMATIESMTVDTILSIVQLANSAMAFGGIEAARDALVERGYSTRSANRIIEMAPIIAGFFAH